VTTPGEEIARRLDEIGLPPAAIVRALISQLDMTEAEATAAMLAAGAPGRT
jgi:hypothetical protein